MACARSLETGGVAEPRAWVQAGSRYGDENSRKSSPMLFRSLVTQETQSSVQSECGRIFRREERSFREVGMSMDTRNAVQWQPSPRTNLVLRL